MLKNDNLLKTRHIKAILRDLHGKGERLISFARLSGGKSNAAYKVLSTSNPKGILIRSSHIDKTDMLSFEKNMMASESLATKLLIAGDVPVPKILRYCPHGSVLKKEYAVYEYIESDKLIFENGIAPNINFKSLDKIINAVHEIKGDGFGYLSLPLYRTWHEFVLVLCEELTSIAEKYKFFDNPKYICELREEIASNSALFNEITTPIFVHNDIGLKNFLFKKDGETFSFLRLIDVERCLFGDIDFELSRAKLTDNFCYENVMSDLKEKNSENRAKRQRIYTLLNLLISLHTMRVKHRAEGYFKEIREWYYKTF